jgi:hypothetical protein
LGASILRRLLVVGITCRGPFSGGKVIQAHMCGRLPHDTLVVGLEPDVPPALISTDVEFWFR